MSKPIRVIFVGLAGTGKTSLINRIMKGKFGETDPSSSFSQYTKPYIRNGEAYHLNLVDTPGQEQYESTNISEIRNSPIIVLIFEVTNSDSLENVKKIYENKILNDIGLEGHEVFIVCTKDDITENRLPNDQLENIFFKVDNQDIKYPIFKVSSKSGVGIQNLYEQIEEKSYLYSKKQAESKEPKPNDKKSTCC